MKKMSVRFLGICLFTGMAMNAMALAKRVVNTSTITVAATAIASSDSAVDAGLLASNTMKAKDNKTTKIEGLSVLVFCGYGADGFVHKNIPASTQMVLELAKENGFRADSTSSMSIFNDKKLAEYDVIVYSNASYLNFSDSQKRAFQRFIRRGGGFIGLHAATCSGNKWDWFTKMIGGCFDFHPPLQQFTVVNVDTKHPSVKGEPKQRVVSDEFYIFKNTDPSVRVLKRSNPEGVVSKKPLPETPDAGFPAMWCNEFERGRIWYTALGHNDQDYKTLEYRSEFMGALSWVAINRVSEK